MTPPKIVAQMVTGHDPARRPLALVAIRCFLEQTHPHKELCILNQSPERLTAEDTPGVFEFHQSTDGRTLGELRNALLDVARERGDWLTFWDDDDWHHPHRLTRQLAIADREGICLLGSQLRHSTPDAHTIIFDSAAGIAGTLFHHAAAPYRFPALNRHEDSSFASRFSSRQIVREAPELYCRFYHGGNVSPRAHIMESEGVRSIGPRFAEFMRAVVLPYYAAPSPKLHV